MRCLKPKLRLLIKLETSKGYWIVPIERPGNINQPFKSKSFKSFTSSLLLRGCESVEKRSFKPTKAISEGKKMLQNRVQRTKRKTVVVTRCLESWKQEPTVHKSTLTPQPYKKTPPPTVRASLKTPIVLIHLQNERNRQFQIRRWAGCERLLSETPLYGL